MNEVENAHNEDCSKIEEEHRQSVDKIFDQIADEFDTVTVSNVDELAREFLAVKQKAKEADDHAKRLKTIRDSIADNLLTMLAGLNKKRHEVDGRRITVVESHYYSLPSMSEPERRQLAIDLIKTLPGGKDIVYEQVSGINAFLREFLEHPFEPISTPLMESIHSVVPHATKKQLSVTKTN